eukprot:7805022-Prorocentrum_lima.AAC.1
MDLWLNLPCLCIQDASAYDGPRCMVLELPILEGNPVSPRDWNGSTVRHAHITQTLVEAPFS